MTLKCDKLWPTQCVYLRDRLLAVLSVQHQTIHLYQIEDTGALTLVHQIGRFIFDDDRIHLPPMRTSYAEAFLTGTVTSCRCS